MSELLRPYQDVHLIEAYGAPPSITNNPREYRKRSILLIRQAGLTILGRPTVHSYPGQGLSFSAFLSESAITGHTWPNQPVRLEDGREFDYANYLLHTCSRNADFNSLERLTKEILQALEVRVFHLPLNNSACLKKGRVL